MSRSLLYHGFGVRGYEYVMTDYREGEVLFTIRQPRSTLGCPECGSVNVFRNVSIHLRQLEREISEESSRFARCSKLWGPVPTPLGFFQIQLGCSKTVVVGDRTGYRGSRLVKRSRALRGRNPTRDSQVEGASKAHRASGERGFLEAFFVAPRGPAPRFAPAG